MRNRIGTLGLVALLATSACVQRPTPGTGGPEERTTLRVDNRNFSDYTIYVIANGGQRIRLGTATGSATNTFVIPKNVLFGGTRLRFLADPIGSNRTAVSDELTVTVGDQAVLEIPPL